jgi:hypothetical protein
VLRRARANTPPTAANGTLRKMSAAGRTEPKAKKSIAKMRARASGTTTASRRLAAWRFSNCPPQRM